MAATGAGEERIALIVHGGAWAIPDALDTASRDGVLAAVRAGYQVLEARGSAVDAVEAAVRALEDNPAFDAGTGSVLNAAGRVELDAMVMDGTSLASGAVASLRGVRHPVSVARRVMDSTAHCLLVGDGAKAFADEHGFEHVEDDALVTAEARREYEAYLSYGSAVDDLMNRSGTSDTAGDRASGGGGGASGAADQPAAGGSGHDTVGAVAFDCYGHLASATSTGGITGKRPGRVGDSPLIGSGGYADDSLGACSTTGHGESIMKVALAFRTVSRLDAAASATASASHDAANAADGSAESGRDDDATGSSAATTVARDALHHMWHRVRGRGGIILIDAQGRVAHYATTTKMAWASAEGRVGGPCEEHAAIDNATAFAELS